MKCIVKAIVYLALLVPSVSFANDNQCQTGATIEDPVQFVWTDMGDHFSGTMEIAPADLVINGETITTRVYRQQGGCDSIPGPTMKMVPGEKYVLRFNNLLPYEVPSTEHNVFKNPNVSNLHTHGLHISGETPGDDVTRNFPGGFGGDFVYDILGDHMGGTFWYHAHHHGSTYLQVSGGAFGLLVVDDAADGIPREVAEMAERQLVIAYLDPDVAGTGGDTLITGTLSPTWTVNGHVNGNLVMPPNTWQHFRILLADRDAKPKTISIGDSCEVALLARDGVWRTTAPLDLANGSITITGASRADLAVRCQADASISVADSQVASITIEGTADTGPSPYVSGSPGTWSALRPDYLRDLRGVTNVNTESVNMGARTINGSKFDIDVPTFAMDAVGVQEWTLKGARNHPFHLHIYHVQISGNCADYENGEYYDVVASNCAIRFDLNGGTSSVYEGRTIMHCHILEHEDQGAMGWLKVNEGTGGLGPPTFPEGFDYLEEYSLGNPGGSPPAAPDSLIAVMASSSQINLSWQDNSDNEVTFDIERSADPLGEGFSLYDYVLANITSYQDTGLTADTTWYYRVKATNSDGASAYTNTANATTDPGGVATTMFIDGITVSAPGAGGGFRRGSATVVIRDDAGGLVEGATVTGDFRMEIAEAGLTGLTDATGSTTIESTVETSSKGKVSNLEFCITGVSHPDLQYGEMSEICGSL
jgi:FtsP/CotA-like multicopper oxidase with cupredoxin domain